MKRDSHYMFPVNISNVTKRYTFNNKSSLILNNITLNVSRGELLLLLGPSGSGKTTLLTIIAGLIPPTSGEVLLFDNNIPDYSKKEFQKLLAEKIGFVFQSFNLIDSLSAIENILLSAHFARTKRSTAIEKAKRMLSKLHLAHLADKTPPKLSQGEKQRVAVARSFINNPDLILADEPTASLEARQGLEIIKLLHQYAKQENKSVIAASHDQRICKYADRILYLEDGKITGNQITNI